MRLRKSSRAPRSCSADRQKDLRDCASRHLLPASSALATGRRSPARSENGAQARQRPRTVNRSHPAPPPDPVRRKERARAAARRFSDMRGFDKSEASEPGFHRGRDAVQPPRSTLTCRRGHPLNAAGLDGRVAQRESTPLTRLVPDSRIPAALVTRSTTILDSIVD